MLTRAAGYAAWALAAAGAVVATAHPSAPIRGAAVLGALVAVIAWTYTTTAEHYAAVAEENEAWAGTRHVVFGSSEEATHAQVVVFRRQVARTRARLAARRRRRKRPAPLAARFDPACDPPAVTGWLDNGRWLSNGPMHNRS